MIKKIKSKRVGIEMIENNHNTNLVLYDMENFLNKYTRFLSKDM